MAAEFMFNFLRFVLIGLQLVIIGRILMSWVDPTGRSSFAAFLIQTTEPILAPIRKALPRGGMFDFSPLIVIVVLGVLLRMIP